MVTGSLKLAFRLVYGNGDGGDLNESDREGEGGMGKQECRSRQGKIVSIGVEDFGVVMSTCSTMSTTLKRMSTLLLLQWKSVRWREPELP